MSIPRTRTTRTRTALATLLVAACALFGLTQLVHGAAMRAPTLAIGNDGPSAPQQGDGPNKKPPKPTDMPTDVPSSTPTDAPGVTPTTAPTATPTSAPDESPRPTTPPTSTATTITAPTAAPGTTQEPTPPPTATPASSTSPTPAPRPVPGRTTMLFLPMAGRSDPPTFCSDIEDNDTPAQAKPMAPLGKQCLAAFRDDPEGEDDYYSLALNAGQTVQILLNQIPLDADYDLILYDANLMERGVSNRSGAVNEQISYTAAASGRYLLRVNMARKSALADNTYALLVTVR